MARNDVYLNINALSPADAVVTGQQDMTAATVPELVLGDTPTFNFYFTDNTNVWPSWAGNAAYTVTWALSDAVSGDFSPAATTGNATPITGGWSVVLPLNAYDLVGLLNTKRVSQPYPVTNLWQQIRVADPSGNEVTRAMFWTPIRYRAISDTQNTESASPTGGREVTVDNVNVLTTPTAAQFYAANPVPTSALGTAANGELLIGNGTGFTKATLTAGSGVSITNGSGSITITATDGDITLDDGTAAAPSLKFTSDTDTGLFRPSDNVVGISAGGVSRATFGATSAINGTTIPGSKTLVVTTDKLSALAATTSAELAGVISDETGSGALVFATSPTLTTPILGTPQSGTLSSCTGLPISTGVSGLGTNVATFLATPSSANLASAVTDETGTGALVFANTPTLVTPNIGAATGTSVNLSGAGTFGGNLTVSGTGGVNATAGILRSAASGSASSGSGVEIGGGATPLLLAYNRTTPGYLPMRYHGSSHQLSVPGVCDVTLNASGNFLIGTTTDSANGRLQLATHTTSAGGIGFGTDTSLYRTAAGILQVDSLSGNNPAIKLAQAGVQKVWMEYYAPDTRGYITTADSLAIRTNGGTTALTLDTSQNATFAGRITANGTSHVFGPGGTGSTNAVLSVNGPSTSGKGPYYQLVRGSTSLWFLGTQSAILGDNSDDYLIYSAGVGNALTLAKATGNATFAGTVTVSKANAGLDTSLTVNNTDSAANSTSSLILTSVAGSWTIQNNRSGGHLYFKDPATSATQLQINNSTGLATFAGSIAIGNTVQTAAGVASTHKVTISIGGTTYYLLATT